MLVSPPPPGDFLEWALEVVLILAILVIAIYAAMHLLRETKGTVSASISKQQTQLEEVMKELLGEMRKLRKEIEELRKELKE